MKIAIVDTLYDDFLKSVPVDVNATYAQELQRLLEMRFGTFDAYSRNLRALGHKAIDIIGNHSALQNLWADENGCRFNATGQSTIPLLQIDVFRHDVVFMQDMSFFDPLILKSLASRYVLAAQCSCAFDPEAAKHFDIIFTSIPSHVAKFEALNVRAVYLPLAFDPIVMEGPQPERDIEISFVGGVGRNSHWREGTDVLEAVAAAFGERFHFYGYGLDNLPADSALRGCYRGQAWGKTQYDIYRRSKIVVNRHGEIASGFTNNLRVFEATGCGALLLTEDSKNIHELFDGCELSTYEDAAHAVSTIRHYLADWKLSGAERNASYGQQRTLRDHTYAQRMPIVADVLQGILCAA